MAAAVVGGGLRRGEVVLKTVSDNPLKSRIISFIHLIVGGPVHEETSLFLFLALLVNIYVHACDRPKNRRILIIFRVN